MYPNNVSGAGKEDDRPPWVTDEGWSAASSFPWSGSAG
eukprot:CAMPEP_0117565574 /NCGR_PEP_ID=MMETSP0784-20121206/56639_1 /TAXON_ID=39447 /ORGANISM="" /LENGTH=37 /DNA_ID= /DNA_START= /DNA_END= /DNA_ORIENTATION=